MSRIQCKTCRRVGESLCGREKCAFRRRPYAPGILDSQRKHRSNLSEYGEQMKEKQKLRKLYGLREKQFSNYIEKIKLISSRLKVNEATALCMQLEERLDNVVYRTGMVSSRALARQLVSHGHIVVNGKKITIPSAIVKVGDVVAVREGSKGIKLFTQLGDKLKDTNTPAWMTTDPASFSFTITDRPNITDLTMDIQKVLEFYAR